MFSLGHINFIAPLLPTYKSIVLSKLETYPELSMEEGLNEYFIEILEKSLFCIVILLFIILIINYFLRKTLNSNKFEHNDIVRKNRILRLNEKIRTIHVWSMSLLVGLGLFSISYHLGPNDYTPL